MNSRQQEDVFDLENMENKLIFDEINFTELTPPKINSQFEENFDVYDYYTLYGQLFFEDKLGMVKLEWSKKMTLCAGIFSVRNHLAVIRLSEPLLKFRSVSEIKETLLHEMIHAWCFVEKFDQSDDRSGHGIHFKRKMTEINKNTGLNITVYHSFHDEVDYHRKHVWRCNGSCRNDAPYFGWVKRAMNRKPGSYDRWWKDHEKKCGGVFIKIETENTKEKEKDNLLIKKKKAKIISDQKNNISDKDDNCKNLTLDNFIKTIKKN